MNYLWPGIIIVSYLFALISGNIERVNNAIFTSITDAVTLIISLVGNMCLWCGIMNIVKNTRIIERLKKVLKPFLNRLFKEVKHNEKAINDISINIVCNMLGIGNAATPAGLNAMKELQKENKNKNSLSNSMVTLIVLNTASLQIIPTTVIAIRTSLGSKNPTEILTPIWISTITGCITALIVLKATLNIRRSKK